MVLAGTSGVQRVLGECVGWGEGSLAFLGVREGKFRDPLNLE